MLSLCFVVGSLLRSLAHLLLGYDMEAALAGRLDESLLLPSHEYSCLTIVERLLTQHGMRWDRPRARKPPCEGPNVRGAGWARRLRTVLLWAASRSGVLRLATKQTLAFPLCIMPRLTPGLVPDYT